MFIVKVLSVLDITKSKLSQIADFSDAQDGEYNENTEYKDSNKNKDFKEKKSNGTIAKCAIQIEQGHNFKDKQSDDLLKIVYFIDFLPTTGSKIKLPVFKQLLFKNDYQVIFHKKGEANKMFVEMLLEKERLAMKKM